MSTFKVWDCDSTVTLTLSQGYQNCVKDLTSTGSKKKQLIMTVCVISTLLVRQSIITQIHIIIYFLKLKYKIASLHGCLSCYCPNWALYMQK